MALPFDYLDSMVWSIAVSAVLIGVAAIRPQYKAYEDTTVALVAVLSLLTVFLHLKIKKTQKPKA